MKAVIYGGGNIGRGFIGQLFFQSGYEITFIDVNTELIDLINAKKKYPIRFSDINNSDENEIWIENVSAINGNDKAKVTEAIRDADLMAISVGVNVLKYICEPVAIGINSRFESGNFASLNIIICENLIRADKVMREGILPYINEKYKSIIDDKIGFVESSVGRMVPIQTDEMKDGNSLRIVTESFCDLPVDASALRGNFPAVKNMTPFSPFKFYIERKLFLYNMGHAVVAYLGDLCGYEYIWESVCDPYLKLIVLRVMQRSAFALAKKHGADINKLNDFIENLLCRFANAALGDTVQRVGNDLKRKLSPNDRLCGVLNMCREYEINTTYINFSIAAAVNFKSDKLSGQSVENILSEAGSIDLIGGDIAVINSFDAAIKSGKTINELSNLLETEENKT